MAAQAAGQHHHVLCQIEGGVGILKLREEVDRLLGPAGHGAGGAVAEVVDAKLCDAALHRREQTLMLPIVQLKRCCGAGITLRMSKTCFKLAQAVFERLPRGGIKLRAGTGEVVGEGEDHEATIAR